MRRRTPKTRLLVYGTLMRGHPENRILAALPGARYLARAWVGGYLFDLGAYPGAVLDARASSRIEGELWEADYRPGMFRGLDEYEAFFPAHPEQSLFFRTKARVHFGHDTTLAWVYVIDEPSPSAPLVATGRWDTRKPTR
jgi:gamma-glutamylcyclotransferase (GGCT)/AIG2-like uncharacterized protein YtfP